MVNPLEAQPTPSDDEFTMPRPAPIDLVAISENRVAEIQDVAGFPYGVYEFSRHGELPIDIARWFYFHSYSDETIAQTNEGDRHRFTNPDFVAEHFLKLRGGRDLYVALSEEAGEGELYGATWLHELKGDEYDFKLVAACRRHLVEQGIEDIDVKRHIATLATRVYADADQNGLAPVVQSEASDRYFQLNPECWGIVGRFGSVDPSIQTLMDEGSALPGEHLFKPIHNGPGFVVMLAIRDSPQNLEI